MTPSAHLQRSARQVDGDYRADGIERALRIPFLRIFRLPPLGVETLAEVAFAMSKCHRGDGNAQVRRRPQCVSGEDSESSGVGRKLSAYGDLRREVGDTHFVRVGHRFSRSSRRCISVGAATGVTQ
jgi:hypothetical protein